MPDGVGLRLVDPAPPATVPVSLLEAIDRIHAPDDLSTLQSVIVECVERLVRGSAAGMFRTTSDPPITTLCAAGPGWRSAERDAPAWLAPLSGALAQLVRSEARLSGRFVRDREGHGPDLALVPFAGDGGPRFSLLVAWPPGLAARQADLATLDRLTPHVDRALRRTSAAEAWRETTASMRLAHEELVGDHAERAASSVAAGAAHDLNNSLSVLLGLSDCLLTLGPLHADTRRDVEEIHDAARRTARLAERLAFIGRSPQDGADGPVDVPAVVAAVRDRLGAEGLSVTVAEPRHATSPGGALAWTHAGDLAETVAALLRLHFDTGAAEAVLQPADDGWRLITATPAPPGSDEGDACSPCYDRRTRWRGPLLTACRRMARRHGWTLAVGRDGHGGLRVVLTVPMAERPAASLPLS